MKVPALRVLRPLGGDSLALQRTTLSGLDTDSNILHLLRGLLH
jgi:hypothetical protein